MNDLRAANGTENDTAADHVARPFRVLCLVETGEALSTSITGNRIYERPPFAVVAIN